MKRKGGKKRNLKFKAKKLLNYSYNNNKFRAGLDGGF
jgi:hypothetical protein